MRAAVWYGKKDIRVEDRVLKNVKENELKIEVEWAGICGSDLHEYSDGPIFIPTKQNDPLTNDKAPITLGHEFSGIVKGIGEKVTDYNIGDYVTVNPMITNKRKPPNEDLYDGFSTIGLTTDGGFADYVIVPKDKVVKLPNSMSLKEGALIEPAAVAVQAVKEANIKIGDSIAVFGSGPIGLLTIMAAKAAGAINIIALDLSETRLKKAQQIGATHVINSSEHNSIEAIKDIQPEGVNIAFEVAGVEATFNQAIQATKIRGSVMIVSIFSKPVQINPMNLTTSAVKIGASLAYEPDTFKKTMHLISKEKIKAKEIISDEILLEDIVIRGFESLINNKNQSKILVNLNNKQNK